MTTPKPFKVTYKKHRETGLAAVGAGFYIEVKHKRKMFAIIRGGGWQKRPTTIQFAVDEEDGGWKWRFLDLGNRDESEAKQVLEQQLPNLLTKYKFHFFDK